MVRFFLSFLFLLLCPHFFPKLHLLFFAPYLIWALYKYPLMPALWRGIGCGILVDLFSSSSFFGLTSLVYVLCLIALSTQTRNFFEDKVSTLPLMTTLFSFIYTLLTALFYLLFDRQIFFNLRWIVTDLFEMSLIDGVYAFFLFSLPFHLTPKIVKLLR